MAPANLGRLDQIDGVEQCRALVELDLADNRVARLPDAIGALASLQRLNLAGNPLTELPASFGALAALEELVLSGCPVARLPADLSRLTWLRRVLVANTLLPADEQARLRAAVPAVEIVGAPAAAGAASAKPYSMKLTYAVGDTIVHPTFGAGVVRAVLADGRIDVAFHAGPKTLAHGQR